MPKMKNTKKQSRRTLPNMGRVSNSSITKILMPFQKSICQCLDKHLHHLHTWNAVDGPERPEHTDRPDGGEVELLHVEAVLQRAGEGRQVGRGNYRLVFSTQCSLSKGSKVVQERVVGFWLPSKAKEKGAERLKRPLWHGWIGSGAVAILSWIGAGLQF